MARKTQVCGRCGTTNATNAKFCSLCGHSLASGSVDALVQLKSSAMATTVGVSTNRRITGTLPSNHLLGGRYHIVEMIGTGGFGAVYKARDERFPSKPVVAIKEMSDSQLSPNQKARALQDFHNEADLLVRLKHPNLPTVSDFVVEEGKAYFVM